MAFIKLNHLSHDFAEYDEKDELISKTRVLDDLNAEIQKGSFIAILGHNGSGKSTLAKHLNALLFPDEGSVEIDGMNTESVEELWKIRRSCGMVFQNPDNQIIGTTVEEDVAFGPENLGISTDEIRKYVDESLKSVEMIKYRKKSPNKLSGGQKQRVAIASSMALRPECIVLDEPTAMLDPMGRKEVINTLMELNRKEKMTIILITHHMEEAALADYLYVMDKGKIVLSGKPRNVFTKVDELKKIKLDVPVVTEMAYLLYKRGKFSRYDILTTEEFVEEYKSSMKRSKQK